MPERPLSCADVTADVTVLLCVPRRVQERLQELHQGQVVHGARFLLHGPDPEVEEGSPLPSCDLVVHKAVNDLALLHDGDAAARYATLQKLAARGVPMLDPLESMPLFADRGALCRALEAAGPSVVRQPRYLEVCASSGSGSVLEAARAAGLRLPLLCKPLLACRPPASTPNPSPHPHPHPHPQLHPHPRPDQVRPAFVARSRRGAERGGAAAAGGTGAAAGRR